ncbi:MAG: RHS repeat-associated core domain-containing protein [Anaeromyxobacter sp.]
MTNLRLPGQYDERLLGSLGLQGPYYNWNRWYLPGVGRYLEPDPIALDGEFNSDYGVDWYSYGSGNPLKYTDRFGLFTKDRACLGLPKETDVIMAADAVTDVNLKQCILKQNEHAHLRCPEEPDPACCDDGSARVNACAGGPGTCKVTWCNRVKPNCSADVLVHEFAHNCGWKHNGGKGVPHPSGVAPGACSL